MCARSYVMATKRKLGGDNGSEKPKRPRTELPDYCAVESVRAADGEIIWPAPLEAMDAARDLLREWYRSPHSD